MKPMLAEPVEDKRELLRWIESDEGMWWTPKIDGIRALTLGATECGELGYDISIDSSYAVARSLKPIPNTRVHSLMAGLPPALDGELFPLGATCFAEVEHIMAEDADLPFAYYAFDFRRDPKAPYVERVAELRAMRSWLPSWVHVLEPERIRDMAHLDDVVAAVPALGFPFEGIILRRGSSPYKFNRSTLREAYMLKMKSLYDFEATIVGVIPLKRNTNEQKRDERGYAKRSSAKAGKVAVETLGAIEMITDAGVRFKVGTGPGLTDAERARLYAMRDQLPGRRGKVQANACGGKTKPREPRWLGLRHPADT